MLFSEDECEAESNVSVVKNHHNKENAGLNTPVKEIKQKFDFLNISGPKLDMSSMSEEDFNISPSRHGIFFSLKLQSF